MLKQNIKELLDDYNIVYEENYSIDEIQVNFLVFDSRYNPSYIIHTFADGNIRLAVKEKGFPLIEVNSIQDISPENLLMFSTKGVVMEDFIQYKKPALFISNSCCDFKCDKENKESSCCNFGLSCEKTILLPFKKIIDMYVNNPITSAIVFGGLDNFYEFQQLYNLIICIRDYTDADIVIYTGYYRFEIREELLMLKEIPNIIVKFGRYIPNEPSHFDEILGVNLASSNQYAVNLKDY